MKVELNTQVCPLVIPDTYGSGFQNEVYDDRWDDFKELLCKYASRYIKDAIKDTKSFKSCPVKVYERLHSPREYNYTTDWVDFSIEISDELLESLKDVVSDSSSFYSYIKRFGSRPGFASYYPVSVKEVADAFTADPDSNTFCCLISEIILWEFEKSNDLDAYQADFIESVTEYASGNGYFIDEDDEYLESVSHELVKAMLDGVDAASALSALSESKKRINTGKLEKELEKELLAYMKSQGFDEKEARQYTNIKVDKDSEKVTVNVGAEISYDGLVDLSVILDNVIVKYDPDAYFEPEWTGRLISVIYL